MIVNKAKDILVDLMPSLIIAGNYALNIQRNIQSQEDKSFDTDKEGQSDFTSALTDADLSIQNFIEVILLGRANISLENKEHSDIAFFGEEYASSLNSKYFPFDKDIKITLDPIDGTLFYKNKFPHFSIILTACSKEEMLASLVYQPAFKKCFFAYKNGGAFELTIDDMQNKNLKNKVTLKNSDDKTVVMYKCAKEKKLISKKYNSVDLSTDFDYTPDWKYTFMGILESKVSAVVTSYPLLIDSGAMAFYVREAGGFVSDFKGELLNDKKAIENLKYDSLIMSVNEDVGLELVDLIS